MQITIEKLRNVFEGLKKVELIGDGDMTSLECLKPGKGCNISELLAPSVKFFPSGKEVEVKSYTLEKILKLCRVAMTIKMDPGVFGIHLARLVHSNYCTTPEEVDMLSTALSTGDKEYVYLAKVAFCVSILYNDWMDANVETTNRGCAKDSECSELCRDPDNKNFLSAVVGEDIYKKVSSMVYKLPYVMLMHFLTTYSEDVILFVVDGIVKNLNDFMIAKRILKCYPTRDHSMHPIGVHEREHIKATVCTLDQKDRVTISLQTFLLGEKIEVTQEDIPSDYVAGFLHSLMPNPYGESQDVSLIPCEVSVDAEGAIQFEGPLIAIAGNFGKKKPAVIVVQYDDDDQFLKATLVQAKVE